MASVQSTILKITLVNKGLTQEQASNISLLLSLQKGMTADIIYYRCLGMTQEEVAEQTGCDQSTVSRTLSSEKKVKKYLKLCIKC